MTATYNPIDLASSTTDEVRLIIGDNVTDGTDETVINPKLQNEEIDYFVANEVNIYMAAAACAEALASRYAGMMRKSVGPLSVDYGEQATNYTTLAARLRERGAGKGAGGAVPTFGGTSWSSKEETTCDPDYAGTAIRVGMMSGFEEVTEPGYNSYGNYPGQYGGQ